MRLFSHRRHSIRWLSVVAAAVPLAAVGFVGTASAGLPGASTVLTRAPYLTDMTQTSVQVTWATTTQSRQTVTWGPAGSCTANSVTSATLGNPITITGSTGSVTEYQNSVAVTGLSPGTSYCYRVLTGDAAPVDLLGANASPTFTTLDPPASTSPYSFDVFGDWGDTTNGAVNDGTLNANQAGVDAQLAASGARFAVGTGDTAYAGGTQSNYGDLNQTGASVSGVFGPSYWAQPGQSLPLMGPTGNHGQNSTFLNVWPTSALPGASTGVYSMVNYPSIDGTNPGSYPTAYYAFSTGGARYYVLDASWGNSNVGSATGGPCGSHCAMYQVDHDAHWMTTSAQYQWLAQDLAAHPGGLKFAFFHFPLRSDDGTEPSDAYLQNSPGSTASLEQLLHDNGTSLVFNGHAHIYQRNVAPPGGVPSYVTGGGGAQAIPVGGSGCASTDAYAVGWSYSKNKGSKCGSAAVPSADSQVYHFLKVTVNGSQVTVTPTDSQGNTFDVKTYDFSADTTAPSAPAALAATQPKPTSVALTWGAATDNVGVAAYDVYRDSVLIATVPSTTLAYTDTAVVAGTGHTYRLAARDLAGNTTSASVSVNGGGATDTTAPTVPGSVAASTVSPSAVSVTWTASTDNVGVSGYDILRGGQVVATVPGTATSYIDNGLTPATGYSYAVDARDAAGNVSAASAPPFTVTTSPDVTAPTAPGTPTLSSPPTSNQVALTWTPSTDDVGVARYDIIRNGTVVGTTTGTGFTDTTVSAGGSYIYTIAAYDTSGNGTFSGNLAVGTPVAGSLFSDGFESGNLGLWNTNSGLTAQQAIVNTGAWAARETSTGTATYAYKTLPGSYTELWAQSWVNVASHPTSVNLFGYRTSSGASIVNLYIDQNGRVALRNNIGGVTTYSTTVLPLASWHRLVLHAVVNGMSSSVDVTLDGTPVPGLTLTGQNFGTASVTKLQLGETSTGRTYDVAFDDVAVSSNPL